MLIVNYYVNSLTDNLVKEVTTMAYILIKTTERIVTEKVLTIEQIETIQSMIDLNSNNFAKHIKVFLTDQGLEIKKELSSKTENATIINTAFGDLEKNFLEAIDELNDMFE